MDGFLKLVEPILTNPGGYLMLLAGVWFHQWRDWQRERGRLHDRLRDKDAQLGEFIRTFDKLSHALDLLRERLKNV